MDELTDKQESFCLQYAIDKNGKQAAIRAGYSEKTAEQQASRLLSNVKVKARIDTLLGDAAKRCGIDADYILGSLKAVAERCMQAEPVMVRDGDQMIESGEYKFEHSGANKSLELLGKHLKLFDHKEDKGTGEIHIHISGKASKL